MMNFGKRELDIDLLIFIFLLKNGPNMLEIYYKLKYFHGKTYQDIEFWLKHLCVN